MDNTFNPPLFIFFPFLLISSYPKAKILIFSCESITIWPCGVYSCTTFSFPLNKYFANMTAGKGIGKKSESSTKEQMSPSCWKKSPKTPWAMKAEPAQSVRANPTATLLFNMYFSAGTQIHATYKGETSICFYQFYLCCSHKVIWHSLLQQQWGAILALLGRRQRWEVVTDLGLGTCWSSPTFSQSLETSGHAGKSESCVRAFTPGYWWARAENFPGWMVGNL